MGLRPDEIRALILTPDHSYTSKKFPGAFCHTDGEYSLALEKQGNVLVVKTALYATLAGWLRADREGKLPENRPLRLDTGARRF